MGIGWVSFGGLGGAFFSGARTNKDAPQTHSGLRKHFWKSAANVDALPGKTVGEGQAENTAAVAACPVRAAAHCTG